MGNVVDRHIIAYQHAHKCYDACLQQECTSKIKKWSNYIENIWKYEKCVRMYILYHQQLGKNQVPVPHLTNQTETCWLSLFFTKRARVSCLVDAMSPKNWWPTSVWRPFCMAGRASWWRLNMLECNQLVGGLEHDLYDFPFSWECHHPNWRTHIFQRAWNHQPDPSKSKYNDLFSGKLDR